MALKLRELLSTIKCTVFSKIIEFIGNTRSFFIAVIVWIAVWLIISYAIQPPIPLFVRKIYMVFVAAAILFYLSVQEERFLRFKTELKRLRLGALGIPPFIIGYTILLNLAPSYTPPATVSVVHSSPPAEYVGIRNPQTTVDPSTLAGDDPNIKYGEVLYQNNCSPCHGKDADGRGPDAEGFQPKPADFTDMGTIAQLQQSYLLWRITEGGWEEPFFSAMPRWGLDMDEDEMWKIIIYEFKHARVSPRED